MYCSCLLTHISDQIFVSFRTIRISISNWRIRKTISLSDTGLGTKTIGLLNKGIIKNFRLPSSASLEILYCHTMQRDERTVGWVWDIYPAPWRHSKGNNCLKFSKLGLGTQSLFHTHRNCILIEKERWKLAAGSR